MSRKSRDPRRQLHDVEWAIRRGLGPRDLVPMLEKLAASAEPGSPPEQFALQELAGLVVADQPWRAALLCRRLLSHGEDARALGMLGTAHTLLGNFRAAARAYFRAEALAPDCPVLNHNLGHLLDVALDRPAAALRYLSRAHEALPGEPEITASYAHALVRSGQRAEGERLLRDAIGPNDARALLESWAADAPALAG
jgi:Flp pilus assembly protein TadD